MPSMRRVVTAVLALGGILAAVLAPAWPAAAAAGSGAGGRGDRVTTVQFSGEGVAVTLDPVSRTVRLAGAVAVAGSADLAGRVLAERTVPVRTARILGAAGPHTTFQCVEQQVGNPFFTAYTPWHNAQSGTSHTYDWLNELYSVSYARKLFDSQQDKYYFTFQVQYCSSGGGNTSNGYHQDFVGNAMTWEGSSNQKIGWTWGDGTSGTTVGTQLAFQVSTGYGPVKIGATVSVTPGEGTYAGDLGNDGRFPGIMIPSGWNDSRDNTFWVSPANFLWDGTPSYEGNTAQTLDEWPMNGSNAYTFYDYAVQEGFCAELFGCSKGF